MEVRIFGESEITLLSSVAQVWNEESESEILQIIFITLNISTDVSVASDR